MRVWFITGASRGFGALIARDVLKSGDAVVATARDPKTVIAALGDHPRLLPVKLDVTDEAQARAAVDQAVSKWGRIDVLVNNAGYGVLGAVEETSAAEVEGVYRTNVFGLLNVIRAVLPHMRRQRGGHVMNISSIGGYAGYHGWGVYGSTKFAVEGISEALAQEVAPLGIKVTIVEPGFFRTDFLADTSLVKTKLEIGDYHETVGAMRGFAAKANHAQPGNPEKLSAALIAIADAQTPPLRLALGSDTYARLQAKNAFVEGELQQWKTLTLSTDFEQKADVAE